MEIKEIEEFFKLNNFKLIESKISTSFGDYYKVFSNGSIKFRIESSRSYFSIDISTTFENDWFDLLLLYLLITKSTRIMKPFDKKKYILFLVKKIDVIKQLFNEENFSKTKKELQILEKERAKQMFPKFLSFKLK